MLKRYSKLNNTYFEDSNGNYIIKSNKPVLISRAILFKQYQKEVHKLTKETSKYIDGIESIGFYTNHIDHKISIYYGFNNNIKAEYIAHSSNLRVIPAKDNINKNTSILVDEFNSWILSNYSIEL